LLLCRVDTVLADRHMPLADTFWSRLRPGQRVLGCREGREVFREGGAERVTALP
jgi:hypothetical protein